MFIHKQEINLIPQAFLEVLHFKESYNLVVQEHFVQNKKNFARHGVCNGKSIIKKTFVLHCF